jgi:hypothetical protein
VRLQLDPVRRWRSVCCLAVAAGMIHWGDLILQPVLHGWPKLLYWGVCLLLAVGSVRFAFLDILIARRHLRRKQVVFVRRVDRAIRETQRPSTITLAEGAIDSVDRL